MRDGGGADEETEEDDTSEESEDDSTDEEDPGFYESDWDYSPSSNRDNPDRRFSDSRDIETSRSESEALPGLETPSYGEAPDGTPVEGAGVLEDKPVDLRREEGGLHGGHAINRHVNRTDDSMISEFLQRRAEYEMRALRITQTESPVGSFDSLETANTLVNEVIRLNQARIEATPWAENGYILIEHRFGFPTGREAWAENNDTRPIIRTTYGVYVVLWPDRVARRGWRIRTAFPYNRTAR